jgi:hypothetical protein
MSQAVQKVTDWKRNCWDWISDHIAATVYVNINSERKLPAEKDAESHRHSFQSRHKLFRLTPKDFIPFAYISRSPDFPLANVTFTIQQEPVKVRRALEAVFRAHAYNRAMR